MAIAQVEKDARIWFLTDAPTAKTHEIEKDTRMHIVCQNDRSAYLSLGGRADLVRDRAKIDGLSKEPFRAWFPEGKDDPEIVIEVRPEEGGFWDNERLNRIKYLFAAAKAYAAGEKPEVDEGEQHGKSAVLEGRERRAAAGRANEADAGRQDVGERRERPGAAGLRIDVESPARGDDNHRARA
ncbi:MAG: pyridoxamine 5'-phosphate oxidase family protein [Chthoniobacterales bacterium]